MSFSRRSERKKKKQIDPLWYSMYVPDDENPEIIEEKFSYLEEQMRKNKNSDSQTVARQVFIQTATPDQVPMDVWWDMGNDEDDDEDKDQDATFIPGGFDDGEDFVARRRFTGSRSKSRAPKTKVGLVSASQQIEHLGAGIDLWPLYKVQQLDIPPQLTSIHEYPNRETLSTRKRIFETIKHNPINLVNRITAEVIRNIVHGHIDAIIMDPPFGHNDWTKERFHNFIKKLENFLERTFLIVWADPQNLELIQEVFEKSSYVFCDSIAIELLSPTGGPYFLPPDEYGFRAETRMAIMFRTNDINRNDLKQQRVKDTGFGTVYENGKSYGRLGLPLCVHEIVEIMLPDLPNHKRTFVELWPSFYTRRNGWINIDEKVNPDEAIPDEIMPPVDDEGLSVTQFDDTLINRIIDINDEKHQGRMVNNANTETNPVVIENDIDEYD
ncbi:hypothetical protein M9Y10_028872 [Tritrichomonas musculus]|uniref:Uncharacterized protein n=1 Tax=Tritrichomonas musculus TaxID=1915356 RepID=A0ABR2KKI0_9EUKA